MLRKKKWVLLGGLILLAICMVVPGVSVLASSSAAVTVSGTIPLTIYDVAVSNITSHSAAISWKTNNPSGSPVNSVISYGVTLSYGSSVSETSSGPHSVNLISLSSYTTYYFQIQSTMTGVPTATYTGSFKTSGSVLTQTKIGLISVPNPSDLGQAVYFGAGVILPNGSGNPPTGTITLYDITTNPKQVLDTKPISFGTAGFSISSLSVGTHDIQATYSGDSNYAASSSNIVVQKVHYDTKTNLTSSPNPSNAGQSVTFKATVSPNAAPGSITFYDGSTSLGNAVTLSNGSASFSTTKLTVGYHNIIAVYSGNNNYAGSTSNIVVQKVKGKTACTWPNKPTTVSYGKPCSFSVQIGVQSGTGNPTGTVTFYDGGKTLGTGSLSADGHAQFGISSLSKGTHSITATYAGDDNFDGSNSSAVSQVIK